MRETGITTGMVTDIEQVPRCITTAHVVHESVCDGCGAEHVPQIPAVPGTSVGPNILSLAVGLYHNNMAAEPIADTLNGFFGAGFCKATILHALQAAAGAMEPHSETIRKGLADAEFLHIDETPFPVGGSSSSHAWVAVGGDSMHVTVAGTRGGAVPGVHYPFFSVPLTCDGYAAYRRFGTIQRCRSHILRDAEDLARRGRAEESLHRQLRPVYHRARPAPPDADCDPMVREAEILAGQYGALGHGFGGKLAGAAPDLFTFVSHPGMEPANNTAGRALRRIVIQRGMRHGLRTAGGMRMFGIIMTCLGTWRMRGLDTAERLREVLAAA